MLQREVLSLCCALLSFAPYCHGNLLSAFRKNDGGLIDDVPTFTLESNEKIPLIGLGVGNLQGDKIENMIYEGLNDDHLIRLFDTAHASNNEEIVARGITRGVQRFKESQNIRGRVQVDVVTKVWYTHLGYERTKLSVLESFEALDEAIIDENVDLNVHILIHWPRCYDGIPWMHCEEEENNLHDEIKKAGPPPHLDKDNAWKESWRALEDMYNSKNYPMMASIGVSNFSGDEFEELLQIARTKPHLVQMNVWSLLNDPHLVDLCNKENVHMQVFNVMNTMVNRQGIAPRAHHHLLKVANEITKEEISASQDEGRTPPPVTDAQVILKWLVQMDVSVIPRTSRMDRLLENSAAALSNIKPLNDQHLEIVAHAMEALLSGTDMEEDVHVKVTFHAKNQDMFLYWFTSDGREKQISYLEKGTSFEESTHPNHSFRLYNAYDPDRYHDYTVQGTYGDHENVHVEL